MHNWAIEIQMFGFEGGLRRFKQHQLLLQGPKGKLRYNFDRVLSRRTNRFIWLTYRRM